MNDYFRLKDLTGYTVVKGKEAVSESRPAATETKRVLAEEAEAHALEMDERLAKKGAARKIRTPKKGGTSSNIGKRRHPKSRNVLPITIELSLPKPKPRNTFRCLLGSHSNRKHPQELHCLRGSTEPRRRSKAWNLNSIKQRSN